MSNSNNEYKSSYQDINECISRGSCSISPTISSLQEVAMLFLRQLAHYILQLEKLGGNNETIKFEIINILASLVSVNEFSEKQLYSIILKEYYLLNDTQNTYQSICKKENIPVNDIKKFQNFKENTSLSQAITLGEKIFLEKYKKLTLEEKNYRVILQIIIKSLSLNLAKLADFNAFDENIYHDILETLDMFNHKKISIKNIRNQITKLAEYNTNLQIKISELLLKSFDGIFDVKVSHSTKSGKAILVSGNNFFDLLNILEQTKDKGIDIYTHSNLLITHALKKFHNYKHLIGHYGDLTENCILDFATFPGAILLTKNSKNNTEYLYRGRLFSNDFIVPNGVIKIENDDYSELINSALNAKGFSKGKIKEDTPLGYNEKIINEKFIEIIKKLKENTISKLYIIGIDAQKQLEKEYFEELFTHLKKDEYVISFSYKSTKENVLTIPIGNYIPLATYLIHKLFQEFPISNDKIVFYFTTCDVMTIANIINLKEHKAQNVYLTKCPATLINPAVSKTLSKEYKIKEITDITSDLSNIRKKEDTQ